jgi:hypothetical protein
MKDLVDLARTVVGRNFSHDEWKLYFSGENYRKTFDDLPEPNSPIRNAPKAIEVLEVFHAQKSRKIISQITQFSLFPTRLTPKPSPSTIALALTTGTRQVKLRMTALNRFSGLFDLPSNLVRNVTLISLNNLSCFVRVTVIALPYSDDFIENSLVLR